MLKNFSEWPNCSQCTLLQSCLCCDSLQDQNLARYISYRVVNPREFIFRRGQAYTGIYLIRTGLTKIYQPWKAQTRNFREFIVDFPSRGEIIGTDGFVNGVYEYHAQSLETCSLCHFSEHGLERMLQSNPDKVRLLLSLSRSQYPQTCRMIMAKLPREKFVAFLLDIAAKRALSGLPSLRFRIPIKRREIADHLGIATETLSRILKDLQGEGVVTLNGKEIQILKLEKLKAIVEESAIICPKDLHHACQNR